MTVANDTIFVMGTLLSTFSPSGQFLGSSPPQVSIFAYASNIVHTPAGIVVIRRERGNTRSRGKIRDDSITLSMYSVSQARISPAFFKLPIETHIVGSEEGPALLGQLPAVAVSPEGRIYFTPADTFDVRVRMPDGTRHVLYTAAFRRVPTNSSDLDDFVSNLTDGLYDASPANRASIAGIEKQIRSQKPVRYRPVVGHLAAGTSGVLVERYDVSPRPYLFYSSNARSEWDWLSPAGEIIARVSLPTGLRIHEFRHCRILGIAEDGFERGVVVRFDLQPPPPASCPD